MYTKSTGALKSGKQLSHRNATCSPGLTSKIKRILYFFLFFCFSCLFFVQAVVFCFLYDSVGQKTSKSQSSTLSRSLESLGKESDDSKVSQCNTSLLGPSHNGRGVAWPSKQRLHRRQVHNLFTWIILATVDIGVYQLRFLLSNHAASLYYLS